MADSSDRQSSKFMRKAGEVNDPDNKLPGPVKWVASLVQRLIALIIVTLAEGFKAIFTGEKSGGKRREPRKHDE